MALRARVSGPGGLGYPRGWLCFGSSSCLVCRMNCFTLSVSPASMPLSLSPFIFSTRVFLFWVLKLLSILFHLAISSSLFSNELILSDEFLILIIHYVLVVCTAVLFISFLCSYFGAVWLYLHISKHASIRAHTELSPPHLISPLYPSLDWREQTSVHDSLAW